MWRDSGAYACFPYPSEQALTDTAHERLATAAQRGFASVGLPDSRQMLRTWARIIERLVGISDHRRFRVDALRPRL